MPESKCPPRSPEGLRPRLRQLLLTAALGLGPATLQAGEVVPPGAELLRVLTLNLAHGRGVAPNQLLVAAGTHRDNVGSVADLLKRVSPDVVALQEADGPSLWSGRFDHVSALAERAGYAWRYRADHARSWLFRYGTALLSRLPLENSFSRRFAATPPSPRKGFVVSELEWPAGAERSHAPAQRPVDVVSVHLDYMSATARQRQMTTLAELVNNRARPTIVLGDFNAGWRAADSPIAWLASNAGLHGFEPDASGLATHGADRIDWILLSEHFRFVRHQVLPDVLSDHRAVMADVALR